MSGYRPLLKKPKIEVEEEEPEKGEEEEEENPEKDSNDGEMEEQIRNEQEEALVALIEHRTKEVEHLRQRINYYKSQLEEAEKRLEDTQTKLVRLRGWNVVRSSKNGSNGRDEAKGERKASSPSQKHSPYHLQDAMKKPSVENPDPNRKPPSLLRDGISSKNQIQPKPPLVIPAFKTKEPGNKSSSGSGSQLGSSALTNTNNIAKLKGEKTSKTSSELENVETQPKGTKRNPDHKEHVDLIPLIAKKSSVVAIRCHGGPLLSSQHKRKLRSLALCPTNDQLFVTSALDGIVNLWQLQGRGSSANLLSSTDCQSDKQRRWPEDIAWHPHGNKLFSVYSADGGDSQISILNLNKGREKTRVSFLKDKPHVKGIINGITFLPWDDRSFVTCGCDHAVVLWTKEDEGEDLWKPRLMHKNHHSSAVMGIAGMEHKNIVMSAGADKRIIGFDVTTGRADYRHQIDSKCMSVLANPCDFNLFMVQTGTPEQQIRLFDLRLRQMEIHSFGFKQESSESQSALINQAWSPDGLYISSGSVDPIIHMFDIRYNSHVPSQSIKAHQKRVFKAAWHYALPLLISISSDLNIGLHKIN